MTFTKTETDVAFSLASALIQRLGYKPDAKHWLSGFQR
jgi:hypothetical protein